MFLFHILQKYFCKPVLVCPGTKRLYTWNHKQTYG